MPCYNPEIQAALGPVVQAATDEAVRIWTTTPRSEWPAAVAQIPLRREISGMVWPMQETVRQRLLLALSAARVGGIYLGMSAENRLAGSDG